MMCNCFAGPQSRKFPPTVLHTECQDTECAGWKRLRRSARSSSGPVTWPGKPAWSGETSRSGTRFRLHVVGIELFAELGVRCELCVAPCPVDCISMVPLLASPAHDALTLPPAEASRARYQAHNERIVRRAAERAELLADKKRAARVVPDPAP